MSDAPRDPVGPREVPGALALLRWSAILMGASLVLAAVAIPILHWLGFAPKG